jgi:DHA1 family bicyclomycin/chloramphenicol resistance-like MFS transporter
MFALAMTLLMGVMNGYLASSELMLEATYGLGHIFPIFFGVNAVALALASLNNARIVGRLGITTVVRRTSVGALGVAGALALVAVVTGGKPAFWIFAIGITALLPLAQGLIPNCNTAALLPVAAVAGTASAIVATVSTAGSAMIGAVLSGSFDGTIRPYAFGSFGLIAVATVVVWSAVRTTATTEIPVSVPVE